jgi:hypothetical protein
VKTKIEDSLQKEEQFNVKIKTKGSLNKESGTTLDET